MQVKRDMANFYLSSLVATPQSPWRVCGAAILARHINHAAAACLLQRQQQQHHHLSTGGDNDDLVASSSTSSSSAMAQSGSRGDTYGESSPSQLPLDNTLSLIASMLSPPPPSSSTSSSTHASPTGASAAAAAVGRCLTERDLSDALNAPFLVASLALAPTTTITNNNISDNNNDASNHDQPNLALDRVLLAVPSPLPVVLSLTLPMRQLLALFLVRVWQFPVRLDAALSPSQMMVPEPLSLFEGKRLAEVGRRGID